MLHFAEGLLGAFGISDFEAWVEGGDQGAGSVDLPQNLEFIHLLFNIY